ncbi:MAG: hypothetical protein ACYSU7_19590, partial [Planctomycetota bacterium]
MVQRTLVALGVGGMLFLCSSAPVQSNPGFQAQPGTPGNQTRTPLEHQQSFLATHPATGFALTPELGRIERVYGRAFSHGATGAQSAENFRLNHSRMFGAEPQEVVPIGALPNGQHVVPVMYQPETGTYKMTAFCYTQQRDGVPVFRSNLKLLVRNEAQNPLVLASVDLRDLGNFQVVDAVAPLEGALPVSREAALAHTTALSEVDGLAQVDSWRRVIWAGVGDMDVQPRLADEFVVTLDIDKWRVLTDAQTGDVLYEERLIHFVDLYGTVEGGATMGIGADICDPEIAVPLPYLRVNAGGYFDYSDENGDFVIDYDGLPSPDVTATLDGLYFDVFDFFGNEISETDPGVTLPGPAYLLFNELNNDELVRSQVNGYVHANLVRDWLLDHDPAYPVIATQVNFPVYVNRTDVYCPGNAWYSGDSINFCMTGSGYPNTAWSSVVYHEYGHHIVEMGGSGQCEYGEGMSDVVSTLLLDDPNLGWGFFGNCNGPLRSADNNCQYSASSCTTNCGGPCHDCGRLISGCFWSTRTNLTLTEPANSSITPSITIDVLTLDDNDSDISNGTPHYSEINSGFSDHGMPGPPLALIAFEFPDGHPDMIAPSGGTTMAVNVTSLSQDPDPGTGSMFVDTGSGYTEYPMSQGAPNEYVATFPAADCGTNVAYYFRAETTTGGVQLS